MTQQPLEPEKHEEKQMIDDENKPMTRCEFMVWILMLIPGVAFYGAIVGYFFGWFAK